MAHLGTGTAARRLMNFASPAEIGQLETFCSDAKIARKQSPSGERTIDALPFVGNVSP
jgi:hypothetical protein